MLKLLKKIKKLKVKELKLLAKRLEIINERSDSNILSELSEALNCCDFHFYGGFTEDMGDICPCNCFCNNCEMIPQSEVLVRMQEIGQNMTEENVINEFIEEYGKE